VNRVLQLPTILVLEIHLPPFFVLVTLLISTSLSDAPLSLIIFSAASQAGVAAAAGEEAKDNQYLDIGIIVMHDVAL